MRFDVVSTVDTGFVAAPKEPLMDPEISETKSTYHLRFKAIQKAL